MKLLYGIQGTGNGHITRSTKIIESLLKMGIEVDVLISGTDHQIETNFAKFKFKGFKLKYDDNGNLKRFKSIFENDFKQFIRDIKIDISEYDKIISDYEPITAFAGKLKNKKVYGLSNQYSFLSNKIPKPNKIRRIDEFIIKNFAPVDNPIGLHYEKYDDFIETPIIRDDIREAELKKLDHYTVYLPQIDINKILQTLSERKEKFHIFSNKIKKTEILKNCKIEPTNKDVFFNSFISSNGIITSAGFQTTSEALFTGKKLLVIPIYGQYEQECNALSLQKLGVSIEKNLDNIDNFIKNDDYIKINWIDNTSKIIDTILT